MAMFILIIHICPQLYGPSQTEEESLSQLSPCLS